MSFAIKKAAITGQGACLLSMERILNGAGQDC
ncbi:hypothetical protein ACUY4Q_000647 [Phytobacter sp. AG2a]|jgi:hypothetical protein